MVEICAWTQEGTAVTALPLALHSNPWTGILTEWCNVPTNCPILINSSRSSGVGQRLWIVDGAVLRKMDGSSSSRDPNTDRHLTLAS